jgi:hypothetical protein
VTFAVKRLPTMVRWIVSLMYRCRKPAVLHQTLEL